MLDPLLVLPDFNKPFCTDSDSFDYQTGSVIYQDHVIIAHHSISLTKHQCNCTTLENDYFYNIHFKHISNYTSTKQNYR